MKLNKIIGIILAVVLIATGILIWNKPQDAQAVEIPALRTQTSRTVDLGNGQLNWQGSQGAIHYRNAQGNWTPINTSIINNTMSKADYSFSILQNTFNNGQIVRFSVNGSTVNFQPSNLEWSNNISQIQLISIPQAVTGIVTNTPAPIISNPDNQEGQIKWANAYGNGINFQWNCQTERLAKILTVPNLSSLGTIPSYIDSNNSSYLRLNLIFSPSSDVSILVNNVTWDKNSQVQTFNQIEFVRNGQTLWVFRPLLFWDSNGNTGQSVATLRKSGQNLFIEIRVPLVWLKNTAQFPVYIDTDVNYLVGASSDDVCVHFVAPVPGDVIPPVWQMVSLSAAELLIGSVFNNTAFSASLGDWLYDEDTHYYMAIRFGNVTIGNSNTINNAVIQLTPKTNRGNTTANAKIQGLKQSDTATFSTLADLDGRPRTTAVINWTSIPSDVVDVAKNTTAITSVVQELVNQAGWASGNHMGFVVGDWDGLSSVTALRGSYSWDSSTTKCPEIFITYTAGGGAPTPVGDTEIIWIMSMLRLVDKIYLN